MTIALGILVGGGAVLAADMQETEGYFKTVALKIHAPIPLPGSNFSIAITGAGPSIHLEGASQAITSLLYSRPDWNLRSFEGPLQECIGDFYRKHVSSLPPHVDRDFRLIVVAQSNGTAEMWTNETTVVKKSYPFEAVGSGSPYAQMAIGVRIVNPQMETAVLLAIRAVTEAKTYDQFSGHSTSVVCLKGNQAVHIPWYLIKPVEELFGRYAGIEQSAFQYLLGHFPEDEEKRHLSKMSSWYRKARGDFRKATAEIAKKLARAEQ